jgi:hypothetical protein
MLRLVCVISLLLAAACAAMAGEPDAASRRAPARDKWLRVGLIWSSTALDLASTRYALSSNPAVRESNPVLTTNDGRLRTGVFLGFSLPLDALASYANLKYPHSRSIRILTYVATVAKLGVGVQNFRQGN